MGAVLLVVPGVLYGQGLTVKPAALHLLQVEGGPVASAKLDHPGRRVCGGLDGDG